MKEILGHYKLRPRRAVTFIMQDSKPVYSLRPRSNSDSYFRNTWNYSQTSDLEPEHENDEQLLQAAATPRSAEEKEPPIHIPEEIKEKIESYDQTSDEKEDVLYEYKNGTDVLVAATKERLVRIITSASNLIDNDFLESFLVSYRNWFSPEELLDLISDRLTNARHGLLLTIKGTTGLEQAKCFVQIRIVNTLRKWITIVPSDFDEKENPSLFKRLNLLMKELREGADRMSDKESAQLYSKYIDLLSHTLRKSQQATTPQLTMWSAKAREMGYPTPLRPKGKITSPLDISAVEFARQLTLYEKDLLDSIKLEELLKKRWQDEPQKASNVVTLQNHFNLFVNWVSAEVVTTPNLSKRIAVIENFLQIAKKLLEYNNFTGSFAIYLGLSAPSVSRLRHTWKGLSKQWKNFFAEFQNLMSASSNYGNLRAKMKEQFRPRETPMIPCLPILQKDIFSVEELNNDYENGKLININKLEILGKILKFFRQCQSVPYRFVTLKAVISYIKNLGPFMTKDQLQDFSRRCESFHEEPARTKKHSKKEKKKKEKVKVKEHEKKHSSPIIATARASKSAREKEEKRVKTTSPHSKVDKERSQTPHSKNKVTSPHTAQKTHEKSGKVKEHFFPTFLVNVNANTPGTYDLNHENSNKTSPPVEKIEQTSPRTATKESENVVMNPVNCPPVPKYRVVPIKEKSTTTCVDAKGNTPTNRTFAVVETTKTSTNAGNSVTTSSTAISPSTSTPAPAPTPTSSSGISSSPTTLVSVAEPSSVLSTGSVVSPSPSQSPINSPQTSPPASPRNSPHVVTSHRLADDAVSNIYSVSTAMTSPSTLTTDNNAKFSQKNMPLSTVTTTSLSSNNTNRTDLNSTSVVSSTPTVSNNRQPQKGLPFTPSIVNTPTLMPTSATGNNSKLPQKISPPSATSTPTPTSTTSTSTLTSTSTPTPTSILTATSTTSSIFVSTSTLVSNSDFTHPTGVTHTPISTMSPSNSTSVSTSAPIPNPVSGLTPTSISNSTPTPTSTSTIDSNFGDNRLAPKVSSSVTPRTTITPLCSPPTLASTPASSKVSNTNKPSQKNFPSSLPLNANSTSATSNLSSTARTTPSTLACISTAVPNPNDSRVSAKTPSPLSVIPRNTTNPNVTTANSHFSTSSARSSKNVPLYELDVSTSESPSSLSPSPPSVHQRVQSWQTALAGNNKSTDNQRAVSCHNPQSSLPQALGTAEQLRLPSSSPPPIPSRTSATATAGKNNTSPNHTKELSDGTTNNNSLNNMMSSPKKNREVGSPTIGTRVHYPAVTLPPKIPPTQDVSNNNQNISTPPSPARKTPRTAVILKGGTEKGAENTENRESDSGIGGTIAKDVVAK